MLKFECFGDEVKIHFSHLSRHHEYGTRGTSAVVEINNIIVGSGSAYCHTEDNFCKAEGRKRALTRAISGLTRSQRTIIWENYGESCSL